MDEFKTERVTFEGREFEVALYYDIDHGAPWDEEDGHGPVRVLSSVRGRVAKRPGERLMHDRGHAAWAYDWAEAMRIACRDSWGISPDDRATLTAKLMREPTHHEILQAAVQANFDHLRAYLREEWFYIGVCVRIIGPDGEPQGDQFANALWGVDYGANDCDYWRTVADELADEILSMRRAAWRAALSEARQRRYWASRDVMTEGAH